MNTPKDPRSGDILDTIVIGGGQAGLTMGFYLSRQGRDIVILDAHPRVGDAWRRRWDSLRLFTPAKYNGLPGMPFPGDPLAFPTKDEQADYLEAYATRFALPVRGGVRVERLTRDGELFVVAAGEKRWVASTVVVATGGYQTPVVPTFAGGIAASVHQVHSSAYRGPAELRAGDVLVVGLGNSGAEIALEVSRTHRTWVAGAAHAEIPFRHGRTAARFALPVVRFLGVHVLTRTNPIGRRVIPKLAAGGAPLIRTKSRDLHAAGVQFVDRVAGVRKGRPVVGGRSLDVSNVIWCTGFREDLSWIELPIFDDDGHLMQRRGVVDSVPGLYFLGQELLFAQGSATLPGVGRDARYVASRMARGPRQATDRRPTDTAARSR